MATGKRYPGWTPWAVAAVFALVFAAIAFIGGLGFRPRGDASGTSAARTLQPPVWVARAVVGSLGG